MAGYAGFSMSNNAVDAYRCGFAPASKIGIPDELLDQWCPTDEWHHSSKAYNRVYFYNARKARVTFGLEKPDTKGDDGADSEGYAPDPDAIAALAEWRREKRGEQPEVYTGCTVKWIEWEGSLRKPKAYPQEETGCVVSVKSYTATIVLPTGRKFTKRTYTNGFDYTGGIEIAPTEFEAACKAMFAEHEAKAEAERQRAAAEAEAQRIQWEADAPKRAAEEAAAAARWLKGARRRATMAAKRAAAKEKLAEERAAAERAEEAARAARIAAAPARRLAMIAAAADTWNALPERRRKSIRGRVANCPPTKRARAAVTEYAAEYGIAVDGTFQDLAAWVAARP